MRRLLALVVLAGGTVAGVYLASTTDAPGAGGALRAATCNVRVSDECLAQYPALKRYETVRFPVLRDVSDGGLSFVLPRALGAPGSLARECIEVVDWSACDVDPCATFPAVCNAWDAGQPVKRVRTASKYVIPDCRGDDGGWVDNHASVDCLRLGYASDGGYGWAGCNVMRRADAKPGSTACLDAPTGVVYAGERLEDSL